MNDFDAIMAEFESTMEEFESTLAAYETELQQYRALVGETEDRDRDGQAMSAYREGETLPRAGAD